MLISAQNRSSCVSSGGCKGIMQLQPCFQQGFVLILWVLSWGAYCGAPWGTEVAGAIRMYSHPLLISLRAQGALILSASSCGTTIAVTLPS